MHKPMYKNVNKDIYAYKQYLIKGGNFKWAYHLSKHLKRYTKILSFF